MIRMAYKESLKPNKKYCEKKLKEKINLKLLNVILEMP